MATSPMIGGSDPVILKSLETQTPSVARTAPATVNASTGTATSTGSSVSRGLVPQVSGGTVTYNQATQATAGNSVTVTSSTSNDPGDVVTIYTSPKAVSVSAINQTVNTYKVNNYAGNEYTDSNVAAYLPTFTGNVGAGNVNVTGGVYTYNLSSTGLSSLTTLTVSATSNLGAVGNVTITGGTAGQVLSTNGSGVLSWVSDATTYGNSNVVSLMGAFGSNTITTTGNITGGNIDIPNGYANVTGNANTVGGGATVGVRSILAIDSAFGSNDANDPASAQAVRGRVTGSNLTKTRNYVAGVTGQYLVTGTNASEFINTGLLGVVGDQTTTANAAVVAYLDGDGGLTTAGSAYGVSMKNSTPGSGFDYGLDLQFINLNVAGTTTPFKQADIRFNNGVTLVANTAGNISINANVTVGNIIGNGQALTGIAGANVTGNVGNANLSQYLNVSDVNNNFSYHVVLSAGSGDKSLHIDADDNLQYNPSDGTLTSTRVDATYVLANLNFANGYLASNLVGSTSNIVNGNSNVSITTANGDITLSAVGTANVLVITGTGANITGTANISGTANVGNLNSTSIVKTGVFVTANIPAAATAGAGARAFVTDATVATFGSAYVGGAANAVPVYSDGTGWFIG
jgi:hypothetical protein